jgi:hypothetical protein
MRSQIAGVIVLAALQALASDVHAQQGATNANASAPAASGASGLTRAQVKADTAKASKAGTAPVDTYGGEVPGAAARPASGTKLHLPHRKPKAASSAASAAH